MRDDRAMTFWPFNKAIGSPRRLPAIAVVAALTGSLAACSVTISSSSKPKTWSNATAQANYLADVKPANDLIKQLQVLTDGQSQDHSRYNNLCAALANSDALLAGQMSSGLWPDSVRAPVNTYVGTLLGERTAWQACARTSTDSGIPAALQAAEVANHNAGTAAGAVRIALGLPGN
jgi:hypothetical protein